MRKFCKHCGLEENEHHDFEATMPDGCVCPPNEWVDTVPQPCDAYEGDGVSNCTKCEHDAECHKKT